MKELIEAKKLKSYLDEKVESYFQQYNALCDSGLYRNEIREIVNDDLLLRDIVEIEMSKA